MRRVIRLFVANFNLLTRKSLFFFAWDDENDNRDPEGPRHLRKRK